MVRYCNNCCKEFDFKIGSVNDLDHLVCPQCGAAVDKNSKKPQSVKSAHQVEDVVSKTYSGLIGFGFATIILSGVIGIVSFILKWNILLYLDTLIGLIAYLFIYGLLGYGTILLALGMLIGGLCAKSFAGICLGLTVAMMLRRFLGRLTMKLVAALVQWSKR